MSTIKTTVSVDSRYYAPRLQEVVTYLLDNAIAHRPGYFTAVKRIGDAAVSTLGTWDNGLVLPTEDVITEMHVLLNEAIEKAEAAAETYKLISLIRSPEE